MPRPQVRLVADLGLVGIEEVRFIGWALLGCIGVLMGGGVGLVVRAVFR